MVPEEIRAAAEVHHELGPEYSDAVVASFLAKVDSEIAARAETLLASMSQAEPAAPARSAGPAAPAGPADPGNHRTLLKGIAIGATPGGSTLLVAMTGNQSEARHRVLFLLLIWLVLAAGYGAAEVRHRHQPASRRTAIGR